MIMHDGLELVFRSALWEEYFRIKGLLRKENDEIIKQLNDIVKGMDRIEHHLSSLKDE